ncbi:MAG: glycosyl hydrolase [Nibricoccus sp.]
MKTNIQIFRFLPLLALVASVNLIPAAHGEVLPDDRRFGAMTHFAHGWDPRRVSAAEQAAIPSVRDELYWQDVESEKGRFAFPASYDRYMAALAEKHIEPLIILSYENKNYDDGSTPYTDAGIAAFARYAVEVLKRYGSQIKAVEVWNEYNGTFCKGPAVQDRPGNYLRMLRAVYIAVKKERPDVLVIGGGTSGIPLPYWKSLLAGGALDFVDALSVHPYRYSLAPEGLEQEIVGLRQLVAKYNEGRTKPIWVTEIGWYTKSSTAPGDLEIDDLTQAKFLVRSYALLLSAGVERVYWYLLHDYKTLNMGLYKDDAKLTIKPAGTALKTMVEQLRGAKFVKMEITASGVYSLVFARQPGDEVRVMWSLTPTAVPVKNGLSVAVDIAGSSVDVRDALHLTDSPLFVTGAAPAVPRPAISMSRTLTDSIRDFAAQQGNQGWSYGVFVGDSTRFVSLSSFNTTNWTEGWGGQYPYLTVTAHDQHPSLDGKTPVAAVRRWESNMSGTARIKGEFRCGTQGDGVGVSILVDGTRRFRKLLGGNTGQPILESFDLQVGVQPGTAIDFAVDPGPTADISYDSTTVSVTIKEETQ